ncbi:MAG: 7-cyano-7-deazaguanine synthase [Methanotrichaceae archaeon]|nr:7-cyano-7-deazaguanine synthase [Methanotrichaceae archaeon]
MKATVLFSGGKDSALTSLLLEPFFDQIELITFSFGQDDTWKVAALAAKQLGYSHRMMVFEETVLERALEILISTGHPNDALNYVHAIAVETLAQDCKFVADGTRRDDRAPIMSHNAICSLEDRLKMHYLRPLAGLGGRTIKAMASRYIDFQEESSENYPASDFEVGLRHALIDRHGLKEVERIFPKNHMHTRVIRRKRFVKEIEGKEDQAC